MGGASYQPRAMEGTVLHRVVREHFETFRAEIAARTDGGGLPRFVEREFREFLTCGVLSRGFARVRCEGCAFERLVPFPLRRSHVRDRYDRGRRRHAQDSRPPRASKRAAELPPGPPASAGRRPGFLTVRLDGSVRHGTGPAEVSGRRLGAPARPPGPRARDGNCLDRPFVRLVFRSGEVPRASRWGLPGGGSASDKQDSVNFGPL